MIPLRRKLMEMLNSRDTVICAGPSHAETIALALMRAGGFLGILPSYWWPQHSVQYGDTPEFYSLK
jgi:hypothetical protein